MLYVYRQQSVQSSDKIPKWKIVQTYKKKQNVFVKLRISAVIKSNCQQHLKSKEEKNK